MAITYHSGERIQGATTPATATFSDDFTDSQSILDARWISDFSLLQADATNDNLKANVEAGSSLSECVYDFGLVSETKWIIDFDWDVTAFTAYSTGGSAPDLYVLMSSDNDSDTYTGDLVGIRLRTYASALELQYGNGVALNASTDVSFSESASVLGIRYWRFKRTSATSFTATFYSTSADRSAETNAVESLTATISSSYTGLRYFGVFASNNGSGTGSIDSTIDNVKIYDGTTVAQKWFPTFQDHFGTDRWTDIGGFTGVSGGVLTGDLIRNSTNHGAEKSITALDNSAWVMRFKLVINTKATSENNSVVMGISQTGVTGINDPRYGLGVGLSQFHNKFRLVYPVNQTWYQAVVSTAGSDPVPDAGTYYIELKRTTPTSVTLNIFDDSSYSTNIATVTQAINSSINALDNLCVQGMNDSGSGGTWNISIDDLEIYNGVTSV